MSPFSLFLLILFRCHLHTWTCKQQKLFSIGFTFECPKTFQTAWEDKFALSSDFKDQNGHTHEPDGLSRLRLYRIAGGTRAAPVATPPARLP